MIPIGLSGTSSAGISGRNEKPSSPTRIRAPPPRHPHVHQVERRRCGVRFRGLRQDLYGDVLDLQIALPQPHRWWPPHTRPAPGRRRSPPAASGTRETAPSTRGPCPAAASSGRRRTRGRVERVGLSLHRLVGHRSARPTSLARTTRGFGCGADARRTAAIPGPGSPATQHPGHDA